MNLKEMKIGESTIVASKDRLQELKKWVDGLDKKELKEKVKIFNKKGGVRVPQGLTSREFENLIGYMQSKAK